MYTVKHAAALTGISPATLRMWERRYGVVSPARSGSGYRLYDDAAVQRLTAMRALVSAGWSPRLAAGQVMSGTSVGAFRGTGTGTGTGTADDADAAADATAYLDGTGDVDALTRVAVDVDAVSLERLLDHAFSAAPVEEVVDAWLMPALVHLGDAWHQGTVPVAGEHLVSAAVHRRLAALMEAAPSVDAGPRVVVGLARGSRHEIGVLAFATVLRRAGVAVDYLGGDLPPDSWVVSVLRIRPAAVVLSVPSSDDVPAVRDTVAALSGAHPDLPVYVGGRHQEGVSGQAPSVRLLGHHVSNAAIGLAAALLDGEQPPPPR